VVFLVGTRLAYSTSTQSVMVLSRWRQRAWFCVRRTSNANFEFCNLAPSLENGDVTINAYVFSNDFRMLCIYKSMVNSASSSRSSICFDAHWYQARRTSTTKTMHAMYPYPQAWSRARSLVLNVDMLTVLLAMIRQVKTTMT
jgi:hypothetical protein